MNRPSNVIPIRESKILPFRPEQSRYEVSPLPDGGYAVVDCRTCDVLAVYETWWFARLRARAMNQRARE